MRVQGRHRKGQGGCVKVQGRLSKDQAECEKGGLTKRVHRAVGIIGSKTEYTKKTKY